MPHAQRTRLDLIAQLRQYGRDFVDKITPILEKQAGTVSVDAFYPYAAEIVSGLFARIYRFTQSILIDYHLVADDVGRILLRTMLESLIYLKFLVRKSDPRVFEEFKKYGIGQEKLFKMQLQRLVEEGALRSSKELVAFIDSDSDDEIWDELVDVKLKNFEDIRRLAKSSECQLDNEYVLHFQPYSITVHGHWPALKKYNLQPCSEPLHRGHCVPNFALPRLNFYHLSEAVRYFEMAYALWIEHFKLSDEISEVVRHYDKSAERVFKRAAPRKKRRARASD